MSNDKHEILYIEDWNAFDAGAKYHDFWEVALIDHRPKKRRAKDIFLLAQRARFIIVHDSQSGKYGYDHVFPTFKHKKEFETFGPKTMVLSNFEEIPA
jgi:hypothetical protein